MSLAKQIRTVLAAWREWRQAKRDYRALCAQNRAPQLVFSVEIHPDDYEWTGLNGMTGLKTVVPLTPTGRRYMARAIRDIQRTCIRAVAKANREAS